MTNKKMFIKYSSPLRTAIQYFLNCCLGSPSPSAPQQWVSSCNRRPRGKRHYNLAVVIKRTTQPFVKLKDCAWSALKGKEVKIPTVFPGHFPKRINSSWRCGWLHVETVTRLMSCSRKYAHVTTLSGLVIWVDLPARDLLWSFQRPRNNCCSFSSAMTWVQKVYCTTRGHSVKVNGRIVCSQCNLVYW